MWKQLLIFYLTSFVFGGAAFALIYIVKPQKIIMRNGMFLGTYPLKIAILGAIIGSIIIILAFKVVKNKISKKDMFCEIELKINDKTIKTKAIVDTGNFLKEPITNTPVMIIENTLLYECIPKEILNNTQEIIGGDFKNVPENIKKQYITKLKFIPFSSLGKQNGMLVGIKPEYIKILYEDKITKKTNVIVGMYEKSLTKKGEYRALIGIDILE